MSVYKERRRFNRGTVCSYLLGFVAVQIGIVIAVEHAGGELRDPFFSRVAGRLAARRADAPDRPLLLVLGSSRTRMGFDAGLATRTDGQVLVFNFGEFGAGPMLEQVFLRRLLADGVRPDMVLIEVVPLQIASGIGVTGEETRLDLARLTWTELSKIAGYYRFSAKAYAQWLKNRSLVCVSRQHEMHDALGIDIPQAETTLRSSVNLALDGDDYGFAPWPTPTPQERAASIQDHLVRFRPQLAASRLAEGPARAVRELVALCRRENLPFGIILMPECSGLREQYPPEFRADLNCLFEDLRREGEFDLIDAREWVADDGFWDAHHLDVAGAQLFSARFARVALPRLKQQLATPKCDGEKCAVE